MSGIRDTRVPVDGGELAVAEYGPEDGVPVLAIHGITASSRTWPALARLLPDVRLIAPDLRGRARSNLLPGPFGLRQHADDMARVLYALRLDRVVVVGHSMGAFVAAQLAAAEPDRVRALVLVDGGIPLTPPPGVALDELLARSPAALLGPAYERLTRVFPTRADYTAFWRAHPAFADAWNDDVAAYADYDLDPVEDGFRPSANPDAVATDQKQLFGSDEYRAALASIAQPVTVLRAPLGLQAEPPGLYPPNVLNAAVALVPQLAVVEVPDVNHYTVVMTSPGVDAVANAVRAAAEWAQGRLHSG